METEVGVGNFECQDLPRDRVDKCPQSTDDGLKKILGAESLYIEKQNLGTAVGYD